MTTRVSFVTSPKDNVLVIKIVQEIRSGRTLDVKQVVAGMTSLLNKGTRHVGKPWNIVSFV